MPSKYACDVVQRTSNMDLRIIPRILRVTIAQMLTASGSPTKILLEKRGIRKEPENPVKKNLKKDEKGMLS